MKKIVTVTLNPAVDKSCEIDSVSPDSKLRTRQISYDPGGGGINVSRAIKKLGGDTEAVYTSGGSTGAFLEQLLKQEDIFSSPVSISQSTRENLTVLETSTSRQFCFVMPGSPLTDLARDNILNLLKQIPEKPEFLVLSGSMPANGHDDLYAEIAAWAKELEIKVVVDTGGKALKLVLDVGIFLVKPNLRELRELTGKPVDNDQQITTAVQEILSTGKTEAVVISLGAGGARLVTAEQSYHVPTPTVKIKSKVGAGDSMVGGIVMSLALGKSLLEAVKYGAAAGAAAVMSPGTKLCSREDTNNLYSQME